MKYKGFVVVYSENDDLFIISNVNGYNRGIVGYSETLSFAKRLIDFHVNVMETKERF